MPAGVPGFGGFIGGGIGIVVVGGGGEDGEAVVGETGLEIGAEEDVGGLEIAMDQPPCLVDVGQTLCHVLCDLQTGCPVKRLRPR